MSDNSPFPDRTVTAVNPPTPDGLEQTAAPPAGLDATRTSFPSAPPEVGDTLGNYQLMSEIARGGMGVVYRARQTGLDRVVALKMILGQADEGLRGRLLVEAKSAAALDHPNVVPVYDAGEVNGQLYFAMAYIDGPDLKKYAESRGKLPLPEAMKLFGQVVAGVAHAHRAGIIHRDLKPANVLINRDGRPQVTDFGLAKQTDKNLEMTRTGQVMGTPAYMAPEQARGLKVGPAADVYALGGILYYLLTGSPPFVGETVTDILVKLVTEQPVPLREHIPELPAELEGICLKCLAKDPADRYPDAAALAADLGPQLDRYLPATLAEFGSLPQVGISTAGRTPYKLQSTQLSGPPTVVAPAQSRGPWAVAAGAVAVVVIGGLVAFVLKSSNSGAVATGPTAAGGGASAAVTPTGPTGPTGPLTPPNVPVPKDVVPVNPPPTTQPITANVAFPARLGKQDVPFSFELIGGGTVGANAVYQYRSGDKVRFRVTAREDCHLRVWSVDSAGVVVQLFPSQHDPDDRLTAGVTREMPGGRGYSIVAKPSANDQPETLRAMVSTAPITQGPHEHVMDGFGVYASAAGRTRLFDDIRGFVLEAKKNEFKLGDAEFVYIVTR